ncbi:MAG: hypothetical protein ACJ8R9_24410 [Steroidobacteraceae bacterium]
MVRLISLATICVVHTPVEAQWRANQEPVQTPPIQHPVAPPDVTGPFREQYRAAGEPRILLFWNVAFDDSTESNRQSVDTTQRSTSDHATGLDKQTAGPAGEASLRESDDKKTETVEHVTSVRTLDPAKLTSGLSARNAVELELNFREALQSAGVRLFSRAASIRLTQAATDRLGVDPKLIEADAVVGKADLLLEILMVPDQSTPLGVGFKATLTDIKTAREVTSVYTQARPELTQFPSHYVVTETGFEKRQYQPRATPRDIGIALAHEVMLATGPGLARNLPEHP